MKTSHLFPALPDHARVWVYQANRKFTEKDVEQIMLRGSHFIREWDTHGAPVAGEIAVVFDCFVVIAADEQQQMVSGCAIDRSVSLVKEIEQFTQTNLFDRFSVALVKSEDEILPLSMEEFTSGMENGTYNADSLVFNNTLTTLQQLRNEWIVKIKDSWHSRFAPSSKIVF
jgi:hypothetical protein